MLGHVREVRVGDHRDLFDVPLVIANEAEMGDHRPETVPAGEGRRGDNEAGGVAESHPSI
jgi:hypothetical protein